MLKFSIGVGIGEKMSGKEFGENWKFEMGPFLMKNYHFGHKVGPIVFILGENIANC
jgi:hypothetical protein